MNDWFGTSWEEVIRVVTSTTAIYASLVVGLRVAGRRTISQMSSFDVVVTIALGSLLASTALSSSYGRGLAGLLTLLTLQQAVAALRRKMPATRRLLDFSPEVLRRDGRTRLRQHPLTAQLTEDELRSRLRSSGIRSLEDAQVVLLEPDGRISVLTSGPPSDLWIGK